MHSNQTATLLIHCPDRPGLVHAITGFIVARGGNIIDLQQHIDPGDDAFFMRIEWSLDGFQLSQDEIALELAPLMRSYQMQSQLSFTTQRRRVAIFVSKENHCLYDLLARHEAGDLPVEIPMIISNHEHLRSAAERFGIPFHYFAITRETKVEQEGQQLKLLRAEGVNSIVLARYMQIISPAMIREYPNQILNIHHSFLPAFVGAKPYHQAHQRGVKLIGATSHYVTEDLDQGPIIHQDVIRVSHEDSVADLVRLGRDLEKTVLAQALWRHVRNQVLVYQNKTVVFS